MAPRNSSITSHTDSVGSSFSDTDEMAHCSADFFPNDSNSINRSQSNTQKRPLQVSFDLGSTETFFVESLADMSSFDIATVWYSPVEYHFMKDEPLIFLEALAKQESLHNENNKGNNTKLKNKQKHPFHVDLETDHQTLRGLEFRTKKGSVLRQTNRLKSIHAVLQAQREARRQNQTSPAAASALETELIAQAYNKVTKNCVQDAEKRGSQDMVVAQEFCWERMEKDKKFLAQAVKKHTRQQLRNSGANKKSKGFFLRKSGKPPKRSNPQPQTSSPRSVRTMLGRSSTNE